MIYTPKSLKIENFMGHVLSEIDFTNFNSCLIVGSNHIDKDVSNATGKSTIFHAIKFVLFGKHPADTIDEIIRDGAKECSVSHEFYIDSDIYKVIRRRSSKSDLNLFIFKNDEWEHVGQRTAKHTEEALSELLKINVKSFDNSCFFKQGKFSELLEASDAERQSLLKEPLNLSAYSLFLDAAKKKTSIVTKELDKLKNEIESIGDPDKDLILITAELKESIKQLSEAENNQLGFKTKIENLNKELLQLESASSDVDLKKELSEITTKKNLIGSEVEKLNSQMSLTGKKIAEEDSKVKSLLVETKSLTELVEKLSNEKVRNEEDVNKEIVIYEERQQKGNIYIATLKSDLIKYTKALPEKSQCEACFNELTEEYKNKVSIENKERAEKIKITLDVSEKKLEKIIELKKSLSQEIKSINIRNNSLEKSKSNLDLKTLELKKINSLLDSYNKILSDANISLEDKKNVLKGLVDTEKVLVGKLNKQDLSSEILKVKESINTAKHDDANNKMKVSCLYSNKGMLEERSRVRGLDRERLQNAFGKLPELEKKVFIYGKGVKGFSPGGIPSMIVRSILDDWQIESNKILQEVRPNLSLQFKVNEKDGLDILFKINDKCRGVNLLSGGQKMYFSFALKIGLSLVTQKRMGVDFRLICLDEVDQPLDDPGRNAFVEIIKKYHNRFKILVITHNDRLKDKFNQHIMVDQKHDGSYAMLVN